MTYSTPQGPFAQSLPTEDSVEGAIARQLLRLLGPAVQAPDGSLNAADALALGAALRDARQTQLDSASQAFVDSATYMLTELEQLYGVLVDETMTDAARQARLTAFVRTVIGASPQNIESAVAAYTGSATVRETSVAAALRSVVTPTADDYRKVFHFAVIVPLAIVSSPTAYAEAVAIVARMLPAHTSASIANATPFYVDGESDSFVDYAALGG